MFKQDPDYQATKEKYQAVEKEILVEDDDKGSGDGSDGSSSDKGSNDEEGEDDAEKSMTYLTLILYYKSTICILNYSQ